MFLHTNRGDNEGNVMNQHFLFKHLHRTCQVSFENKTPTVSSLWLLKHLLSVIDKCVCVIDGFNSLVLKCMSFFVCCVGATKGALDMLTKVMALELGPYQVTHAN